ncbi:MAG: hypothetical protein RL670_121 [Actinomycetota bacterium]
MDILFASLIEIGFLVVYAAILGMVAPYVLGASDDYGILLPAVGSLASGLLLWVVLIWVGLPTDNAFTWIIVMLAMPVALFFAVRLLSRRRDAENVEFLAGFVRQGANQESFEYSGS